MRFFRAQTGDLGGFIIGNKKYVLTNLLYAVYGFLSAANFLLGGAAAGLTRTIVYCLVPIVAEVLAPLPARFTHSSFQFIFMPVMVVYRGVLNLPRGT